MPHSRLAAGHAASACGEAVRPGGIGGWFVAVKFPTVGIFGENQAFVPPGSLDEAGTRLETSLKFAGIPFLQGGEDVNS